MSAKAEPMIEGQVFGRLTTTSFQYREGSNYYIDVVCECGTAKSVSTSNLRSGRVNSCGCLNREVVSARSKTHGKRNDPIYAVWNAMVGRCETPTNKQYADYGGRGIRVCEEWLKFEGFYSDMGDAPFQGATLEREDNNKGYSRENCKWATRTQQSNNRRSSRAFEYNGKSQPIKAWAEEYGINQNTLTSRLYIYGWTMEQALNGSKA